MPKLHLGCGNFKLDGYINIDISSKIADLNLNINDLSIFKNSSIEEIYCCHVLEHIRRRELLHLLTEWNRVLIKGGVLRLAVPDFEKVVKIYLKNHDMSEIIGFLNGGQRDNYDIHFVNFDMGLLRQLLRACGFINIQKYDQEIFLGEKDDYSKCYLPHMDKTGELMSLNIICTKENEVHKDNIILSQQLKKYLKL